MHRRIFLLILLSLCVVAASGCRSRRKLPAPQPSPSSSTTSAPQPAVPVQSPDRDFVQPEAERPVLSDDIREANRVARERGWIQDAFFGFNAAALDADAQEALRRSAEWLRQHSAYRVRIEGHCDDRGTEQYNLALGERRAETAASYLVALGVDRARIETVSYGEERPFDDDANERAWAQNRRAHLVLVARH
jgi:peptidoglycan-associated lipoprotein